jgi:hypothetical protein
MGRHRPSAPGHPARQPAAPPAALLAALLLLAALAGPARAQSCAVPGTLAPRASAAAMAGLLCAPAGAAPCKVDFDSSGAVTGTTACAVNGDAYFINTRGTRSRTHYFFSLTAGGPEFVLPNASWVAAVAVKSGTAEASADWCYYTAASGALGGANKGLYPSPPVLLEAPSGQNNGVLVCMASAPLPAAYSVGVGGQGRYSRAWTW